MGLKQVLSTLRVKVDWFSGPETIRVEGKALRCLNRLGSSGCESRFHHADKQARAAAWAVTISARSGKTEDNRTADLAVG